MASSISAARAALFDLLSSAAERGSGSGMEGVQVAYGPPTAYEEAEVVALLGVRDSAEDWSVIGNRFREERFTIEVRVKVYDAAGAPADVDTRGFALAEAVRAVLGGSDTLNGAVHAAGVAAQETAGVEPVLNATGTQEGWVIFIDLPVACDGLKPIR